MRQGQMLKLIACVAGLAVLLLLPGAAAAKPDGTKRLQSALDRLVEEVPGGSPGASILIHKGKQRSFVTAGVANVKNGAPFTPDKHMRIASVSKAFSGAVALSLVEGGELDLDESITARVPTLPDKWSTVTLRQLLNHTSGVPSYTKDPKFLRYFGRHLRGNINKQGLIDFVAHKKLEFPAGTDYEYSNTDNIIIAMMAERATGFGYRRLLRRVVTQPLGMRQTTLPPAFRIPKPQIHGYELGPLEDVTECCSMDFVSASGGVYSTPSQLRRFVSGYGGGELFGDDVRGEQFRFVEGGTSEPPGPGANSAGLGIFRYRLDCGTVFGHTGNFPGYTQYIGTTRNGNRSVVVSANRQLDPAAPGVNAPEAFKVLRRIYERATCTALR